MKERPKARLTVVVGAGASIRGGAPSVGDLTSAVLAMDSPRVIGDFRDYIIRERGGDHLSSPHIRPSEPAIAQIDRALRSIRSDHNFEDLLHAVESLEPYVAARTLQSTLIAVRPVLTAFTDPSTRYEGVMSWALLWRLRWDIIRLIRAKVAGDAAAPAKPYLDGSNGSLHKLRGAFTLQVFNLNYDDLFERDIAWDDGYPDPTTWSAFDRKAYVTSFDGCAHVMTHLHGSIRFGYLPPSDATGTQPQRQVIKFGSVDQATLTLNDPPEPRYTDDVIDDSAPIISGANKVLKFTTPPYSYYFSAFQQAAQRNSHLLFLGYGFADPHVNNWVLESIRHHGEQEVRAVVVDYRNPDATNFGLDSSAVFQELCSRLGDGTLDTHHHMAREFRSSGRIGVSLGGYPPRDDIADAIVTFLGEK